MGNSNQAKKDRYHFRVIGVLLLLAIPPTSNILIVRGRQAQRVDFVFLGIV
jgi:hypothetical protein